MHVRVHGDPPCMALNKPDQLNLHALVSQLGQQAAFEEQEDPMHPDVDSHIGMRSPPLPPAPNLKNAMGSMFTSCDQCSLCHHCRLTKPARSRSKSPAYRCTSENSKSLRDARLAMNCAISRSYIHQTLLCLLHRLAERSCRNVLMLRMCSH